jgi:cbb3-type cytochrome oxidase maturation protein
MSVIILLLIASLSVALIFLGLFLWSVKNRQFDDGYAPPRRILFDDPPATPDQPIGPAPISKN